MPKTSDVILSDIKRNLGQRWYSAMISVIGGSTCTPAVRTKTEELGGEIALHNAVLVCGGLSGVMEAACKGASKAGGLTIGILPGDDRRDANKYVSIAIPTGMGIARNALVVKSGQVVIAAEGHYGTLSETGLALAEHIPVISMGGWEFFRHGKKDTKIIYADSPRDAVEKAIDAAYKAAKSDFKHWRTR